MTGRRVTRSQARRVIMPGAALMGAAGAPSAGGVRRMCCGTGTIERRYYTRDERRQWLQSYADELENELKAVKERIDSLKAA